VEQKSSSDLVKSFWIRNIQNYKNIQTFDRHNNIWQHLHQKIYHTCCLHNNNARFKCQCTKYQFYRTIASITIANNFHYHPQTVRKFTVFPQNIIYRKICTTKKVSNNFKSYRVYGCIRGIRNDNKKVNFQRIVWHVFLSSAALCHTSMCLFILYNTRCDDRKRNIKKIHIFFVTSSYFLTCNSIRIYWF